MVFLTAENEGQTHFESLYFLNVLFECKYDAIPVTLAKNT